MNRSLPPLLAAALGLTLLLAACGPGVSSESGTPRPTTATTATASASVTPSPEPTEAPSAEPTASDGGAGGFSVAPHPEADALFEDPDECENLEDGYRLEFPEAWYRNTEIGDVPACSWFSPEFFEVDDPSTPPDEIAIEIFVIDHDRGYLDEPMSSEEVIVGSTQVAVRVEISGTSRDADGTTYEYVVQLGPTPKEGPNLVARADTDMGGEYELNRAVLDRIMASIEFIGSIE
ncbi:MAG TPA: hypothetical protein VMP86_07035 [Candidatus Binatia bacterium]|nr:hypothetical protein [Candidatus Binatia bacterium]